MLTRIRCPKGFTTKEGSGRMEKRKGHVNEIEFLCVTLGVPYFYLCFHLSLNTVDYLGAFSISVVCIEEPGDVILQD